MNTGFDITRNKYEINSLCKKFGESIDEYDIIKWLQNFDSNDQEKAFEVLKGIEYIDDATAIRGFNNCLSKVIKYSTKSKILLLPIGDFGKSATAMTYNIKKTNIYRSNKSKISIVSTLSSLEEMGDYSLVLFDDFFGTGKSAIGYYYNEVHKYLRGKSINKYFICLASMEEANKKIEKKVLNSKVISYQIRKKLFSKKNNLLGNRERVKGFRNFCYEYGDKLVNNGQLGFDNSQALMTFSFGCPNNTLPIFWKSNKEWYPLFPRFTKDKISRSKRKRSQAAYMISLLKSTNKDLYHKFASGSGSLTWKEYSFVTKTDFELFYIFKLKSERKDDSIICQTLGLTLDDYSELIKKGKKRGILDKNGEVNKNGLERYKELCERMNRSRYNPYENQDFSYQQNLYIPNSFRGKY